MNNLQNFFLFVVKFKKLRFNAPLSVSVRQV